MTQCEFDKLEVGSRVRFQRTGDEMIVTWISDARKWFDLKSAQNETLCLYQVPQSYLMNRYLFVRGPVIERSRAIADARGLFASRPKVSGVTLAQVAFDLSPMIERMLADAQGPLVPRSEVMGLPFPQNSLYFTRSLQGPVTLVYRYHGGRWEYAYKDDTTFTWTPSHEFLAVDDKARKELLPTTALPGWFAAWDRPWGETAPYFMRNPGGGLVYRYRLGQWEYASKSDATRTWKSSSDFKGGPGNWRGDERARKELRPVTALPDWFSEWIKPFGESSEFFMRDVGHVYRWNEGRWQFKRPKLAEWAVSNLFKKDADSSLARRLLKPVTATQLPAWFTVKPYGESSEFFKDASGTVYRYRQGRWELMSLYNTGTWVSSLKKWDDDRARRELKPVAFADLPPADQERIRPTPFEKRALYFICKQDPPSGQGVWRFNERWEVTFQHRLHDEWFWIASVYNEPTNHPETDLTPATFEDLPAWFKENHVQIARAEAS